MFYIEDKIFDIGDTVEINKGKYQGCIGIVVFASSRSSIYTGCWNYVIRFNTKKGKLKKRWFGQYDLNFVSGNQE